MDAPSICCSAADLSLVHNFFAFEMKAVTKTATPPKIENSHEQADMHGSDAMVIG
jgi:hypothetical protein